MHPRLRAPERRSSNIDVGAKLDGEQSKHLPLVPKTRNRGTTVPHPYTYITPGVAFDYSSKGHIRQLPPTIYIPSA